MKSALSKGLALSLLGMIYLHQADSKKAREVTGQSLEALTKEGWSEHELQKVKVLRGLICYHLKDYEGNAEGGSRRDLSAAQDGKQDYRLTCPSECSGAGG